MVTSIGELLPEAAGRFGDKTAVVVDSEEFSFGELEARSNRIANGLVSGIDAARAVRGGGKRTGNSDIPDGLDLWPMCLDASVHPRSLGRG